jgi:hypothetical protein
VISNSYIMAAEGLMAYVLGFHFRKNNSVTVLLFQLLGLQLL